MVGDDLPRMHVVLKRALEDADVVVVTGGLGPTSDDVTREAVALVCGVDLVRDPELVQELTDRFAAYGYPMPPQVLKQADVPVGGRALHNPVGSAPGLRLEVGDRVLYALPGPPHELQAVARGPGRAARTVGRVPARPAPCTRPASASPPSRS